MSGTENNHQDSNVEMVFSKDNSVSDARWMLASVVFLMVAVFGVGMIANAVTSVQASNQIEVSAN